MVDELVDRCYNTGLDIAAECEIAVFETRVVVEKQNALLGAALIQSTSLWNLTHLRKVHLGIVPLAGGLAVASMIDQRASHARVVIEWPSGPIQYELNPKGGWTDTMWQNELTSLNMNQGEFELGSHHEGWEGSHYISVGDIDTNKVTQRDVLEFLATYLERHPTYNLVTNNCRTFVDRFLKWVVTYPVWEWYQPRAAPTTFRSPKVEAPRLSKLPPSEPEFSPLEFIVNAEKSLKKSVRRFERILHS